MDRTFAALADPTRRAILARMAEADPGDHSGDDGLRVTDLAEPFLETMSLPAVSKHIRVLERAGLLKQQRDGRVRRCSLDPRPLKQASEWVAFYRRFWSDRLDALGDFLDPGAPQPDTTPSTTQPNKEGKP